MIIMLFSHSNRAACLKLVFNYMINEAVLHLFVEPDLTAKEHNHNTTFYLYMYILCTHANTASYGVYPTSTPSFAMFFLPTHVDVLMLQIKFKTRLLSAQWLIVLHLSESALKFPILCPKALFNSLLFPGF